MRTALLPLSMSRFQRSRREQCSAGEVVHVVQGHPLSLLLLHLSRGQVSRTEGFPHASRLFFFLTGRVSNEDHVVLVFFPPASMVISHVGVCMAGSNTDILRTRNRFPDVCLEFVALL